MNITKYLHSCLLIEEQGKTLLLDPGQYTYEAQVFPLETLKQLDYIVITHEHPDHMFVPFIKDVLQKFPSIQIISNQSVVTKLQAENIHATTQTPVFITTESVPHEKVFDAVVPENILFHLFDTFTDPGDAHHFSHSKQILALPMQAPWGHVTDAMNLAVSLKPQYVIPIHDWHWKDDVRQQLYQRCEAYLKEFGIQFKNMETGKKIEINI